VVFRDLCFIEKPPRFLSPMSQTGRERIESLVLVTVITVLVWLFAEGEVVSSFEKTVQVRFVSPNPKQQPLIIEQTEPGAGLRSVNGVGGGAIMSVRLSLRGSAGQKQAMEGLIAEQGTLDIAVEVPGGSAAEQQTINLRQALGATRLGELGVNITETRPAAVNLDVEPIELVSMSVQVEVDGRRLSEPPTVVPDPVQVRVPASLADEASNQSVLATIDRERLGNLDPGTTHTFNSVPLRIPSWLKRNHVELTEKHAEITVKLNERAQQAELSLAKIPVHVSADWRVLDAYAISIPRANEGQAAQQTVARVRLEGPIDVIDKIDKGQISVRAEVRPTVNQLESGIRTFPVQIDAPEEVTVLSDLPEVTLQAQPRP
jgi:hypothetical protein